MIDVDGIPSLGAFLLGVGAGVLLNELLRVVVTAAYRFRRHA